MLVYRTQQRAASTARSLDRFAERLNRGPVNHDAVTELLVECGELEAGVADARCPEKDEAGPALRAFRRLSLLLGQAFVHSWQGRLGRVKESLAGAQGAFAALRRHALPDKVCLNVPEGYAHYGLYPEAYLTAALRFAREQAPLRAVCIGLRSIGTSLSAVVAAALALAGIEVDSHTVRPRGHPFDRQLQLSSALAAAWQSEVEAYFALVDEGPGLSGSSLACVAQRLTELGVSDDRIVLFPSHNPDGAQFISAAARDHWGRHRKYLGSFEEVWVDSGRLVQALPHGELMDLSGGKWRALFYDDQTQFPAVQPQHERRKYLCFPARMGPTSPTRCADVYWLKFAGLGRFGRAKLERAERLAALGFAPAPRGLAHGFLLSPFVAGRPLEAAMVDQSLLDFIARYMACLRREFPAPPSLSPEDLPQMMRANLAEGLGAEWAARVDQLEMPQTDAACALDGRMSPHEWLRVAGGFIKTDALDHHDDHFYPGCADIAWDLAGCFVEWSLDQEQRAYLLAHYRKLSGDSGVEKRLPFYTLAYLAFRLGYATLAAQTPGLADEAARFKTLDRRYAATLRRDWAALTAG